MAFSIFQLQHDNESVLTWLERYKDFRLLSLKTSPEAFASTFTRESAFTDEVWYGRLANPKATTFVALQSDHIISWLTAIGPLPCTPEESSASGDPWTALSGVNSKNFPLHWRINGMFTVPEARGQGVAKALMERILQFGADEAGKCGLGFTFSIAVDGDNSPARALYKRCGFEVIKEENGLLGDSRVVILMKYTPSNPDR